MTEQMRAKRYGTVTSSVAQPVRITYQPTICPGWPVSALQERLAELKAETADIELELERKQKEKHDVEN